VRSEIGKGLIKQRIGEGAEKSFFYLIQEKGGASWKEMGKNSEVKFTERMSEMKGRT